MKAKRLILAMAIVIAFCASSVFAQSQSGSDSSNPPTIQQRKENQQDRIANGVQSGQLTAGETKNLEVKEAGINHEEHTMRSDDDGHLTSADRARLDNQQNHLSNNIYRDKHNAEVAHYGNNEVGQRRENQQDRIAQGIRSGELRPGQTARLENQEQGINREVGGMRQANGGRLTNADKRVVNQQQNKVSRHIYRDKHE
ncbi:MAG: hypothetical protein ACLQMT_09195 [Candidatus Acidiferrales bacterium]